MKFFLSATTVVKSTSVAVLPEQILIRLWLYYLFCIFAVLPLLLVVIWNVPEFNVFPDRCTPGITE